MNSFRPNYLRANSFDSGVGFAKIFAKTKTGKVSPKKHYRKTLNEQSS
ncbi:hypothetical protein O59_002771 [Cellvibrio sp. BR]|nr:hypothetical protein O59_002771 [Cellvibrio sp. BR]